MSSARSDSFAIRQRLDTGFDSIESEVLAEKASSLGRHGRLVETALAALRAHDTAGIDPEARLTLVKAASRQVWAFFVQRELCGMRDHKDVVRLYDIPPEVLLRLGAMD